MNIDAFRGTGVALVTPFDEEGAVDHGALAAHVERVIEGGVDYLVPCGTTGEIATLAEDERPAVVRTVVEAADGRVPIMAGASSNDTRDAVRQAEAAREAGADALMSVAPYYNKPPQEGMVRHFRAVAEAGGLPLCLYNVPGRTASNLHPETSLRLAEEPLIFAVKEASGSLEAAGTLLAHRPDGFLILSGEDELALPMIALGGDGVVSVVANVAADPFSRLVRSALDGDFGEARRLQRRLLSLMRANFVETNPMPVKAALSLLGGPPARMRLPLTGVAPATLERLRDALTEAGLLDEAATASGMRAAGAASPS